MADLEIRSPIVVPTPTADSHAASKEYVDDLIEGISVEHVIVPLSNVSSGNITLVPGQGTLYRVACTGTTATLANPADSSDADVINVEVRNANAGTLTLTINSSIFLAGGMNASFTVGTGKRWFGALRYIDTVGWFLLASSVQN